MSLIWSTGSKPSDSVILERQQSQKGVISRMQRHLGNQGLNMCQGTRGQGTLLTPYDRGAAKRAETKLGPAPNPYLPEAPEGTASF